MSDSPRVAIVHDAFTQRGGAERLVEHLAAVLPDATVHTAVLDRDVVPDALARRGLQTSFLQPLARLGIPLKAMVPLLPVAFRRLPVAPADVVVASTASFAHHTARPRGSTLVVYCHTPPRFLWQSQEYFRSGSALALVAAPALAILRRLDRAAAARADLYVANSDHTANGIRAAYGRESVVVHPPIRTELFAPTDERSGRFLVVARLKRHKRIDLAVEAANLLGAPLDVIGEGPDLPRLQRLAGPTVRFLGRLSDADVAAAMARCDGLLVPAREDFGMTTAEVQAAGRPPIAFAGGGALEIIRDGETGFLFAEQTAEALAVAMERARREDLDPAALRASAMRFDAPIFDAAMVALVERLAAPSGAAAEPARRPVPARSHGGPRC
jgi:glycosyltransferase involved in cell wall biosynthesis